MSDDDWLRVRRHLRECRYELGIAAGDLYPDVDRVAGTPLLRAPGWLPARPVPLDDVVLGLDASTAVFADVPEPRYSALMAHLAPPAVFENRVTYRLRDAVLDDPRPRMRFGTGRYFDAVGTGEALAHELAAADLGGGAGLPRRAALGSPVDLSARPVNVAISAVTIRAGDEPWVLVHRRDPVRVAHAGGLLQVVPVGVFQPIREDSLHDDFSLWRCLQRELAEELLGEREVTGPLDYDAWPTAVALDRDRGAGRIRTFCLGLGVDPLTLATDLLCAVVVDGAAFDRLFAGLVGENAEGEVSWRPFAQDVAGPMQAAGAAALALAWRHRDLLLTAG